MTENKQWILPNKNFYFTVQLIDLIFVVIIKPRNFLFVQY